MNKIIGYVIGGIIILVILCLTFLFLGWLILPVLNGDIKSGLIRIFSVGLVGMVGTLFCCLVRSYDVSVKVEEK